MNTLVLESPAKVNLFLHVLGRRQDGYHDLATFFHRISLSDTLRLTKRKEGFHLSILGMNRLSCGEDNLITRAYRLLQKKFPSLGGVSVRLFKRIPLGGGLGGGSSNAAFFLLGMKRLYRLRLSERELLKIALQLGADVPFFVLNAPQALGRGVGERLRKYPLKRKGWFVLILSDQGLMTKQVFGELRKSDTAGSLTNPEHAVKLISHFFGGKDHACAGQWFLNHLEAPAARLCSPLRKILDRLRHQWGIKTAGMSGSGSAIFAVFASRKEALHFQKQCRAFFVRSSGYAGHPKISVQLCHSL